MKGVKREVQVCVAREIGEESGRMAEGTRERFVIYIICARGKGENPQRGIHNRPGIRVRDKCVSRYGDKTQRTTMTTMAATARDSGGGDGDDSSSSSSSFVKPFSRLNGREVEARRKKKKARRAVLLRSQ